MISITDYKFKDNKLSWNINNVPISIKFLIPVNKVRCEPILRLYPLLLAGCRDATELKGIDLSLSNNEQQLIDDYIQLQHVYNSYLTETDIKIKRKIKPVDTYFSKNLNNAIVTWSGGKDSTLTYNLLKTSNTFKNIIPCTTIWNNPSFKYSLEFMNKQETKFHSIAFVDFNGKLKQLFEPLIKTSKKVHSDGTEYNLPFEFYHSYYSIVPMLNNLIASMHFNSDYVFMGDEADANQIYNYKGAPYQDDIGQSYIMKQIINRYLEANVMKVRLASVLYPLRAAAEIKLLNKIAPDAKWSSCMTMRNDWCCDCPKCILTYIYYKALNLDVAKIGLNEAKIIENFDVSKTHSHHFPEDSVLKWLVTRGLNYDVSSEVLNSLNEYLECEPTTNNPTDLIKEQFETIPITIQKEIIDIYNK